jgi:hypothetical protein
MEDWVRAVAFRVFLRTPVHMWQLQFHWGKPPPAAAPRTCTNIRKSQPPWLCSRFAPINCYLFCWTGKAVGRKRKTPVLAGVFGILSGHFRALFFIHQAESLLCAVLAGFEIHGDFKAETDILISWFGPHSVNLLSGEIF